MADTIILSLKESIDNLNNSINSLIKLFKEATEQLKMEEHDSEVVDKKISPVIQKITTLEEQNEKIARGIVAVADMLKERQIKAPVRPMQQPQQPMIRPAMPPSSTGQPQQPAVMELGPRPFQPPPVKPLPRVEEKKEEKKGFLDMFKR